MRAWQAQETTLTLQDSRNKRPEQPCNHPETREMTAALPSARSAPLATLPGVATGSGRQPRTNAAAPLPLRKAGRRQGRNRVPMPDYRLLRLAIAFGRRFFRRVASRVRASAAAISSSCVPRVSPFSDGVRCT